MVKLKCEFFDPKKGWGFGSCSAHKSVYLHKAEIEGLIPKAGDELTCKVLKDEKGHRGTSIKGGTLTEYDALIAQKNSRKRTRGVLTLTDAIVKNIPDGKDFFFVAIRTGGDAIAYNRDFPHYLPQEGEQLQVLVAEKGPNRHGAYPHDETNETNVAKDDQKKQPEGIHELLLKIREDILDFQVRLTRIESLVTEDIDPRLKPLLYKGKGQDAASEEEEDFERESVLETSMQESRPRDADVDEFLRKDSKKNDGTIDPSSPKSTTNTTALRKKLGESPEGRRILSKALKSARKRKLDSSELAEIPLETQKDKVRRELLHSKSWGELKLDGEGTQSAPEKTEKTNSTKKAQKNSSEKAQIKG